MLPRSESRSARWRPTAAALALAVALAAALVTAPLLAPGATAGPGTPTLGSDPVRAGDLLACVLPAVLRAAPSADADSLGAFAVGDTLRASGEREAADGGWIGVAPAGWVAAARLDRPAEPVVGELPAGREGLASGRVLPDDWRPVDLVTIPDSLEAPGWEGRRMRLRAPALDAFRAMIEAAAADSVTIRIFSAWRSASEQRRLYGRAVDRDPGQTTTAAPGRSEHRLGTTADVWTPGARPAHVELARTAAGKWIERRAPEFGIVVTFDRARHEARGVAWEPWHLRWVGEAIDAEAGW